MVEAFHPNMLRFLNQLHRSTYVAGLDQLTRAGGMPRPRTLYRWHRALGDRLIYFPSVTYRALGLTHWHLIIEEPRGAWHEWPYAVRAEWVLHRPGQRALYLHCLIPIEHEAPLREIVRALVADGRAREVTIVPSDDGMQYLRGIMEQDAQSPESPILWREADVADLVERYPFIIPVVFEMVEQRRSIPVLWQVIYDRLGDIVWEYLPPRSTRLPHNGKTYVFEALRLVSDAFLVRQHIIRFQPLQDVSIELLVLFAGGVEDALRLLGNEPPLLDIFPSREDRCLVRITSTLAVLTQLFSAEATSIASVVFVDRTRNEREPVRVRFRYEELFDPHTTQWRLPRELILARLSQ